jgi:threonine dehydratase
MSDILLANRFLEGRIRRTPTEKSIPLSDITGGEVFLKWENQQITGSFKIRGALNKMFSLGEEERQKGVVTASSGNHAQGIAMAASMLGVKAAVCVPGTCPETKRNAIRRLGGEWVDLRVSGRFYDDAEEAAHKLQEEEGMTYVSSFEDHWIVSGAGTTGLEMFLAEPELDQLIVPAGGGGLISGVALAARTLRPSVEIWGIQSVASQPYVVSWPKGRVVDVEYDDSLADGLTGSIPQSLLDLARRRISGFIAVTEEEIARAIAWLHREHHQVVEGAGAVGVAALLSGRLSAWGRKVGVVISGGNIDHERLEGILKTWRNS